MNSQKLTCIMYD